MRKTFLAVATVLALVIGAPEPAASSEIPCGGEVRLNVYRTAGGDWYCKDACDGSGLCCGCSAEG